MSGGGGNFGARSIGGGLITLNQNTSVSFVPSGGGSIGLLASGTGSRIVTNGAVSMPGGGGGDTGFRADTSGTVTLNGGSVSVLGNGGGDTALLAQGAGSTLTAAGVTVVVSGGGGDVGAKALGGSAITLSGGSVAATGSGGGEIGLQASGTGSALVASGVIVTVPNSSGGRGVQADNLGSVTLNTGTTVTTAGAGTHAAGVTSGGILNMTSGTLTANGAGSNALNVTDGNATLAGVTLTSPNGTSIAAPSGTSKVTLSGGTTAIVNNGQWLNVSGSSTLNIVMDSSSVQGIALAAAGSTSNVTLRNNSLWTMTGDSNVTNLTNNSSLIQFTPPVGDPTLLSSYKTLTAVNYIGQGGTLGLNTFLGADGSPSDRLVVSGGTATGNSQLKITNTTGAGALTTANGILVVDAIAGGTTVPGAFALAGPAVAGPYEYTLFRSSIDASNPQAWYLRSTLNCTLTPTLPECQTPPEPPVPPTPPTPLVPNYRVETSLYAAVPSMALLYGRNLLDTLHERVGEEEDQRFRADPENAKVGWGRVIGVNGVQQGDTRGVLGGSGGPHFDYTFLGLQAGMDVYRHDRPDGSRDHAGAYFALGGNRGGVTHFDGRQGNSDFNAYSLGGYWTHFGPAGWYIDTILQGTFYDISSSANRGLPTFKTVGRGTAASVEGGYPFRFGGGYFIEPQAQLVFQNININDTNDIAAQIRFADVNSLAGRVGARFGRTWAIDDSPRTITAWIRPNLWNEFQGSPTTSFSSATGFIPFHADLGGLWGEINAGISGQ
jgi:outer membrane autotransporter protein